MPGEGDPHPLTGKSLTHKLDRRGEVAVDRDDDCRVKTILIAVREELGGGVHVRHLLLWLWPRGATLAAILRLEEVVSEVGQVAERLEGIKPDILTMSVLTVPAAVPQPCRKVAAVFKLLFALEK